MEKPENGPSNSVKNQESKSSKKQNLLRKLFGTDSETEANESNENKTIKKNNVFDSYHDDVLEITVDNEYFVTPKKVKTNTPKAQLIANTVTRTHTHKTPDKQSHIASESLTPTVKRILSETIQCVALLSPIKHTPTKHVRFVIPKLNAATTSTQLLSHSFVHAYTSQNHTSSSNHTQVEKSTHSAANTHNKNNSLNSFTSALTSSELKTTTTSNFKNITHANTHTHKQTNTSLNRFTSASSASGRAAKKSHTNTRYNPYVRTHTQTQHSRSNKELIPNTHTITQNRANIQSYNTYTFAQNQTIASASLAHAHTQSEHSKHSRTQAQAQAQSKQPIKQTNALIPIIPKHTQSQLNHSNQTSKQTDLGQESSAPNTKIITLNNKYVPKGVCLAIAIKNNKNLSKNALKKITRNLVSQL